MAGVNRAIILGNLGQNPEIRTMQNGDLVANISVATSERWQDKQTNEWKEQTEWHRIVLYRRLAEIAEQYLKKGSKVYIEGKLKTRKWQDKNGQERYITEIQGDSLQMLYSKQDAQNAPQTQAPQATTVNNTYAKAKQSGIPKTPPPADFDDEMPF